MIPKILHVVWIGDQARLPDQFLAAWVEHHPDWTIKIWNDDDLSSPSWRNGARIRDIAKVDPRRAAAMLRWEILLDEGGVILGAGDFCARAPHDSLLDCEAFACWEDELERPGRACANLVGSSPGNSFIGKLVEQLRAQTDGDKQPVDEAAGSGFLTRVWRTERYTGLTLYQKRAFTLERVGEAGGGALRDGGVARGTTGRLRLSSIIARQRDQRDRATQSASSGFGSRQLLIDVSELIRRDARTGIQRVTRSVSRSLLQRPPAGYQVRPVYANAARPGYFHAEVFAKAFPSEQVKLYDDHGRPNFAEGDNLVEFHPGDIFLGLDFQPRVVWAQAEFLQRIRRIGTKVVFVVYDLLPIQLPHCFPSGTAEGHRSWLDTVTQCDGAICGSRTVAEDLAAWVREHRPARLGEFRIDWSHNGADIANSSPTVGLPPDAPQVLQAIRRRPSFVLVGTLEPRKGHSQTLDAFEQLWSQGVDVHLVIAGKRGWLVDKLVNRLKAHPESGKRLFWLEAISDEYLERIYAVTTCLLFPSEGEGFGLPLIEAAQHRLPILARDLPVFREVAGEHAAYFSGPAASDLARAIGSWLKLYEQGNAPASTGLPYLTWEQSTARLLDCLLRPHSRH